MCFPRRRCEAISVSREEVSGQMESADQKFVMYAMQSSRRRFMNDYSAFSHDRRAGISKTALDLASSTNPAT